MTFGHGRRHTGGLPDTLPRPDEPTLPETDEGERVALEAAIREAEDDDGEDIPPDVFVREVLQPMMDRAQARIEELRRAAAERAARA